MDYTAILDDRVAKIITDKEGSKVQSSDTGTSTGTTVASDAPSSTGDSTTAAPVNTTAGIWTMVGYLVVIFVVFYFVLIRPQRKREKKAKEMREGLRVGDPVLLSSGMYGKIVDVGEDVFVVELGMNRGIRVPVSKMDVLSVKEPILTPKKHDDIKKVEDKKPEDKKDEKTE